MRYADVVHKLAGSQRVTVTGPQRSGTTITTKMLASDLGLPCLLEEAFGTLDVYEFFRVIQAEKQFVIQAPSMAAFCHYLPDVDVVFLRRDLTDIIASQQRIAWAPQDRDIELSRYFVQMQVPPASVKYHFWDSFQKALLQDRAYDLEYETASDHPLWLPKERRVGFDSRRTEE